MRLVTKGDSVNWRIMLLLRFSQRCVWGSLSSGIALRQWLNRSQRLECPNDISSFEYEATTLPRNVGIRLPIGAASHPKRTKVPPEKISCFNILKSAWLLMTYFFIETSSLANADHFAVVCSINRRSLQCHHNVDLATEADSAVWPAVDRPC
jgi:hypothetical protein